ncbi:MAG: type I-U CRISPR-associated protein Csb2 [Xanthobacteraceae bacterium]
MTLVLEVEFLSGVSFAAIGPDSRIPDWPPQPDRVFSALVATWAAHGESNEETEALEWLERLPPPRLLAPGAEPRTAHIVYVPPNDYETPNSELRRLKWYRDFLSKGIIPQEKGGHKKLWLQACNVMPDQRKRSGLKERNFPAARLHDSDHDHDNVVRLFWPDARPTEETIAALKRLAHDTAYVGHSASLTRCRFLSIDDAPIPSDAKSPERRVYDGRLAELRDAYSVFQQSGGKRGRPNPGARVAPSPEQKRVRTNLFSERWLILEHAAGDTGNMPDLRACALVAKTLRDTLLCGYRRIALQDRIPEAISGHASDGSATRAPHVAIIPLPFAGFPHADGHVMGFALVPPHGSALLDDEDFRRVLRSLAPVDEERERRVLTLKTKAGTPSDRAFSIDLSPTFEAGRRSLDPALYLGSARTFATVTPIALDRHLKEKGEARQDEINAQIAAACRNIGLPEPEEIVGDKHSAWEGAPSAYPSGNSPAWMRWRLPQSLASRQLTHAVFRFAAPVAGPVILGAGRFMGLGLCRPLDGERR